MVALEDRENNTPTINRGGIVFGRLLYLFEQRVFYELAIVKIAIGELVE